MDLMLIAISCFTVVVTCSIGYIVIQKLFPHHNQEIEITKAYKERNYPKVIELAEKIRPTANCSLNVYSFVAESYSNMSRNLDALQWMERALTKLELSQDDRIYLELAIGDEYFTLKNYKSAEVHYRTALSLEKTHEKANHKVAQILFFQDQFEKCRKLLRELLKNNPSLIDSRKLYAECLVKLGMHSKAMRHYAFLDKINESVQTLGYAETLKSLKMWDKAYDMYQKLLDQINVQYDREIIMYAIVEICVAMKKYHESLGLIDLYLPNIYNTEIILQLKYLRANIFFLRGDQILALREYQHLYKTNPFYKDLQSFIEQYEKWAAYPFLVNYFTSNENLFENLVIRMVDTGASLVRRTPQFFIFLKDTTITVFFRDLRPMTPMILELIETIAMQQCPNMEKLELWSVDGVNGKYTVTGQKYRFIVRERDDFLVQLNLAVSQMEHVDGGEPLNFVGGFQDVAEVVPHLQESVNEKIEAIVNNQITDEFIAKAFD